MKRYLFLLLSALSLFAGSIAGGYKGTSDYAFISKNIVNTGFTLRQTKGDIQNLRELLKGPVALGVVQEDILFDLVRQSPQTKEKLTIVTPLYPAAMVLIVPQRSEIESVADLSSKRVIVDVEGSGDFYTFLTIQEKLLINPEIFNVQKSQAINALRNHKADAYFFVGNIEDIAHLTPAYKLIPVTMEGYKFKTFRLGKEELTTGYVTKYLVSAKDKSFSKGDLQIFLTNLLHNGDRDYLCGFSERTPLPKEDYIYFACSQPLPQKKTKKSIPAPKRPIKTAIYYDSIEEITLYPIALRDKSFQGYGTSYIVEKVKFDNVVKLMKKELHDNPSTKFVIISKGKESNALSNMDFIYRKLKKAKIPRSNLIKRVIPIRCSQECFYQTTITFEIL